MFSAGSPMPLGKQRVWGGVHISLHAPPRVCVCVCVCVGWGGGGVRSLSGVPRGGVSPRANPPCGAPRRGRGTPVLQRCGTRPQRTREDNRPKRPCLTRYRTAVAAAVNKRMSWYDGVPLRRLRQRMGRGRPWLVVIAPIQRSKPNIARSVCMCTGEGAVCLPCSHGRGSGIYFPRT